MIDTKRINPKVLEQWDTPTICNALDIAAPNRRLYGFTKKQMLPIKIKKPICGFAKTAHIISTKELTNNQRNKIDYYSYVSSQNRSSIILIEDEDNPPGIGAFWGEVNSAIHYALNVRGLVTNGAIRDIDLWQNNFPALAGSISPSHANVQITKFGQKVDVNNMKVDDGDIVHFDQHGAVVIPKQTVKILPEIILSQQNNELKILKAIKKQDFNLDILTNLLSKVSEFNGKNSK